jgi:hypothetical protein
MRTGKVFLLWAILVSRAPAGSPATAAPPLPRVVQAAPAPEWNVRFAGKEGWIGGDGAYSVPLDRDRILWFFGDSLLGKVKKKGRPGAVMVNNTVAVQTHHGKETAFRFVAGKTKAGKPAAFFLPADGKGWFWPQAAIRVERRLFVFLTQINKSGDPGVFGFRHVGQWLAIIDNPDDKPERFRIKLDRVPFARFGSDQARSWGSAVLAEGGFLYVYGYEEQGKKIDRRQLILARVPAGKLDDFSAWQFRTTQGWGKKPEDAAPLAAGLATEFSVTRSPNGKGHVLVYTENGLGDRIVARFANAPEGPWSAPLLVYRCPEMARDRGVFCYAAKAHAWATTKNELMVSYCMNTWEFARLFRDESVYRPQFVRIRLARPRKNHGRDQP